MVFRLSDGELRILVLAHLGEVLLEDLAHGRIAHLAPQQLEADGSHKPRKDDAAGHERHLQVGRNLSDGTGSGKYQDTVYLSGYSVPTKMSTLKRVTCKSGVRLSEAACRHIQPSTRAHDVTLRRITQWLATYESEVWAHDVQLASMQQHGSLPAQACARTHARTHAHTCARAHTHVSGGGGRCRHG